MNTGKRQSRAPAVLVALVLVLAACDRKQAAADDLAARQKKSEAQMRALAQLIQAYANENDGKCPDSLAALRAINAQNTDRDGKPEFNFDELITNPVTGQKPGYIYKKPAERLGDISDPYRTPVLWEARGGQIDPNGARAFADWEVQRK
jgi:type II secretory pathway pseudopilin PulG